MKSLSIPTFIGLLAWGCSLHAEENPLPGGASKPNILFVIADQWRAQAFGFAGDPNVHTPPDREWTKQGAIKEWPQRLLDGKASPTGRFTFATWHHWKKDLPLLVSGLLRPDSMIGKSSRPNAQ